MGGPLCDICPFPIYGCAKPAPGCDPNDLCICGYPYLQSPPPDAGADSNVCYSCRVEPILDGGTVHATYCQRDPYGAYQADQ
ncbi:MAG: hypothetical protein ACYCWW_04935 [Deltaproteobacteria bacterium]